jgi:hypothetical protein
MATCVWTAVGGRAATPDAPLLFFTTLAAYLFVRGAGIRAGIGGGVPTLSLWPAVGIGVACGAATLAKGPIGLVLPLLTFLAFTAWRRQSCPEVGWMAAISGIRPLTIVLAATVVAAPWYAWVTLRTDGEWLRGFLFVHNIGRFASTMEGHSGSILYYPTVVAVGLFPWSIVLAAMLAHAACILRAPAADGRREPLQLLTCWVVVWIGGFSCASTKLPGYVWPAYPALAIATGLFLANWADGRAVFPWPHSPRAFPKTPAVDRGRCRSADRPGDAGGLVDPCSDRSGAGHRAAHRGPSACPRLRVAGRARPHPAGGGRTGMAEPVGWHAAKSVGLPRNRCMPPRHTDGLRRCRIIQPRAGAADARRPAR